MAAVGNAGTGLQVEFPVVFGTSQGFTGQAKLRNIRYLMRTTAVVNDDLLLLAQHEERAPGNLQAYRLINQQLFNTCERMPVRLTVEQFGCEFWNVQIENNLDCPVDAGKCEQG